MGHNSRNLRAVGSGPYLSLLPIGADSATFGAGIRRAGQDADAFGAEGFGAAAEGLAAGQHGVEEWQDHNRDVQAGGLGEHTQGVGVADAQCPLVDRVVAGRATMIASGIWERGAPGLLYWLRTGLPVAFLDDGLIEEIEGAGVAMTWTVQPRSWARPMKVSMAVARARAAHDDGQDARMRFLGHLAIPI